MVDTQTCVPIPACLRHFDRMWLRLSTKAHFVGLVICIAAVAVTQGQYPTHRHLLQGGVSPAHSCMEASLHAESESP
jgi:hypothetical protein